MKTVIEMAGEVLDRMAPDDHCREPYWTATNEELEAFAELVRDEEREACAKVCDGFIGCDPIAAPQPAQQEPVAKKTRIGLVTSSGWDSLPVGTEFYTSPPAQRTWVGLTDEEVINVMPDDDTPMSLGEAFSVFAELVRADEREACAKVADGFIGCDAIVHKIRARSNT